MSGGPHQRDQPHAYVVGGGIAGLATAALLIRDAGLRGTQITVLEAEPQFGGSLDGSGNAEQGYVIRGGRMFEEHFACTFDLFSAIPTLAGDARSVTDDILAFTAEVPTSSRCRLVFDRERLDGPEFGLSWPDRLDLLRLSNTPEQRLAGQTIASYFSPLFLETNFWLMWSTMFAFRPWHSLAEFRRYMRRFMHLLPGFNRLEGIHRTRLNQYDSLIRPLLAWLVQAGVRLRSQCQVNDVVWVEQDGMNTVSSIITEGKANLASIDVSPTDQVFVTLGSMTAGSSYGGMRDAPGQLTGLPPQWALWQRLAARSASFGRPEKFCDHQDLTRWESFTVTLEHPRFFDLMEAFTGNAAGTGGLVSFARSNWLMSVVLAHQPHFAEQHDDSWIFWGYGLHPENNGDHIARPMTDCTGQELLEELLFHLPEHFQQHEVFADAKCIPCNMPFITSQFMPREADDRPQVVPSDFLNLALIGQFCELPLDAVFTVEYSVRSAQRAVYARYLPGKRETPLYRGWRNPNVLGRAIKTLLSSSD